MEAGDFKDIRTIPITDNKIFSGKDLEVAYKTGIKEAYLKFKSQLERVEEFIDYNNEGMSEFRKMALTIVKPPWQEKLKEWGLGQQ